MTGLEDKQPDDKRTFDEELAAASPTPWREGSLRFLASGTVPILDADGNEIGGYDGRTALGRANGRRILRSVNALPVMMAACECALAALPEADRRTAEQCSVAQVLVSALFEARQGSKL